MYGRKGQNTGLLALQEEVCETSWERRGHLEGSNGISLRGLMEVRVPRNSEREAETTEFQEEEGRGRSRVLPVPPPLSGPKGRVVGCTIQRREMRKQRNLDLERLWSGRIPLPSSQHSNLLPGTGIA